MPDAFVNVGGTWKRTSKIYVNVGGVWKNVRFAFVNVGGTWKKYFNQYVVTLSGGSLLSIRVDPADAAITLEVKNDGTVHRINHLGDVQISPTTDWIIPNTEAGSAFEVRATLISGPALASGTLNVWLALNLTRSWQQTRTTIGTNATTLTIEIRDAVSLVVLSSNSYTLTATVDV